MALHIAGQRGIFFPIDTQGALQDESDILKMDTKLELLAEPSEPQDKNSASALVLELPRSNESNNHISDSNKANGAHQILSDSTLVVPPTYSVPQPQSIRRKRLLEVGLASWAALEASRTIKPALNSKPTKEKKDEKQTKHKSGSQRKQDKKSMKRKREEPQVNKRIKKVKVGDFTLPPGWIGKEKIRATTGESMGKENLFYYSPKGQFFRSLARVKEYVEKKERKAQRRREKELDKKDKSSDKKKKKKREKWTSERKKFAKKEYPQPDPPKKKQKRAFLSVTPKISKEPKEKEVVREKLTGQALEDNISRELKIAGQNWVGRSVECYWAYPADQRGFYPGIIRESRRLNDDIEYFVEYTGVDSPSPEWEVVDDGMRFLSEGFDEELQAVIEIRKLRGTYIPVKVLQRPQKKKKEEKHTNIGDEYQIDLDFALNMAIDSNEDRGGTLTWCPEKAKDVDVSGLFDAVRISKEPQDPFSIVPLRFPVDPHMITKDQILALLYERHCDVEKTKEFIKEQQLYWSQNGVVSDVEWTSVDVLKFEFAMKQFSADLCVVSDNLPNKTFEQVIEFYWRWRSSVRFEGWRHAGETLDNLRRSFVSDAERNSRLRRRPRVDYSFSKLPTDEELHKMIDLGLLEKATNNNCRKATRSHRINKADDDQDLVYDVGVYVDIFFADEDRLECQKIETRDSGEDEDDENEDDEEETDETDQSESDSSEEEEMEVEGMEEGNATQKGESPGDQLNGCLLGHDGP